MSAILLLLTSGERAQSRRRLFQILLVVAVAPAVQKVQSILLLLLYKSKRQINSNNMIIRITRIITVSNTSVFTISFFMCNCSYFCKIYLGGTLNICASLCDTF